MALARWVGERVCWLLLGGWVGERVCQLLLGE